MCSIGVCVYVCFTHAAFIWNRNKEVHVVVWWLYCISKIGSVNATSSEDTRTKTCPLPACKRNIKAEKAFTRTHRRLILIHYTCTHIKSANVTLMHMQCVLLKVTKIS